MRFFLILACCAVSILAVEPERPLVSHIEMVGAPALQNFETRAGDVLDPNKVQHDIKALWQSQQYSDIRVETAPDGDDAVRVVFRAQSRHLDRLANVRIEPATPGINLGIAPGAEIDDRIAQQIATAVRSQLESSGFPDAAAEAKLLPAGPGKSTLVVHIDKRQQVDIDGVTLSGELGASVSDLRKALRATKSKTMIPGIWHLRPGYSSDAVQGDIANLRSFYYKRGYFDANVRAEPADIQAGKARIAFDVDAGPRYMIRSLTVSDRPIPAGPGGTFPAEEICHTLFEERRQAERAGILDFSARMEVREAGPGSPERWADVSTTITRGREYQTGLITFRGNKSFSDLTLRRAILLQEGAPLDETVLRKSLARINETGFFEPLTEHDVVVNTPPDSDRANVTIWLKEKKMRSWSFSGPVGPMSVAGPLEFSLGSRLPPWGRGILELSTYTVSLKLMLFAKPIGTLIPFLPNKRFIPLVSIGRPMLPGQPFLSGGEFVPQLGWQGLLLGYGASQAKGFLGGVFSSDRGITPPLPVTVANTDGSREGTMLCEMSKTKLDWARQIGGLVSNMAFAFLPF